MEDRKKNSHELRELFQMQALPLKDKVLLSQQRIKSWYETWVKYTIYDTITGKERMVTDKEIPALSPNEEIISVEDGQVFVSTSGGKDSLVLSHLVTDMYPNVEHVFVNTGLEYIENQKFVMTQPNITVIRPSMRFDEVIKKYGYPFISKEVSECVYQAKLYLNRMGGGYSYRLERLGIDIKSGGGRLPVCKNTTRLHTIPKYSLQNLGILPFRQWKDNHKEFP